MSHPTEQVRWLDDPAASDALKHALREQGEEGPTSVQRAQLFEQLANRLEHASSAGPFGKPLVKAGLWSAGILLLGSAGWWLGRTPDLSPPADVPVIAVPTAAPAPANQVALPAPIEAIQRVQPAPAPRIDDARPAARPRGKRTAETTPAATPAAPSVDPVLELSLLTRARRALLDQPQRALEITAEHERDYAQGLLAEEREVIAIEALLKLGKRSEAARRAQRFVARFPGSAQRARLEQLLRPAATPVRDASEVLPGTSH